MKNINDGGQAFPYEDMTICMSLRDWFAGMALTNINEFGQGAYYAANKCYEIADAMLKARG